MADKIILYDIKDFEPQEYVKVKHGHWIIDKDRRWHCSDCDRVAPKGYRYPYCPYCGVRMDEVEE